MEREVPIIISTKFNRKRQILFRVAEHKQMAHNQSVEQSHNQVAMPEQKRNKTVSKRQKSVIYTRARRISSSAAYKRFPKDFFRPQAINQSYSKAQGEKNQRVVNMLDTFSMKCIPIRIQEQSKHSTICKNEMTPEFRSKKQYQNNKKGYLNSQRNSKRLEVPALQKFFSYKQENSQLDLSKVSTVCVNNQEIGRQLKQIPTQFSSFNLTLGQKLNMALFLKKDKDRKRMTKLKQKQNTFQLPFVLKGITLRKGEQTKVKSNKI